MLPLLCNLASFASFQCRPLTFPVFLFSNSLLTDSAATSEMRRAGAPCFIPTLTFAEPRLEQQVCLHLSACNVFGFKLHLHLLMYIVRLLKSGVVHI